MVCKRKVAGVNGWTERDGESSLCWNRTVIAGLSG